MKRQIVFLIVLVSVLVSTSISHAQNRQVIEYGQTVTGEITLTNSQVNYQFTGSKGDVIIAEMTPTVPRDFSDPILVLLDMKNNLLVDTSKTIPFPGATLAFDLLSDGTYTLVATRGGRSQTGEFTLRFLNLSELNEGNSVDGETGTKIPTNYYAVREDNRPLTLTYRRLNGDFAPNIAVDRIDGGVLKTLVFLSGDALELGQVNIPEEAGLYIIAVGPHLFNSAAEDVQSQFELRIS